MNRKLRMFSLAVIAALALSAVGASGAPAVERHFVTEQPHTIGDATKVERQEFKVTGGGLGVECQSLTGSSTNDGTTFTSITMVITYSQCTQIGESRVVHITTTSCHYVFTATKTNAGVEGGHSQVHIVCSTPGDHIHLKVTTIIGQLNCLTIPAQTPTGGGVIYETGEKNGKHDITISPTVEGITYTEQGACGSSTGNNGTYAGKFTISATTTAGAAVGITWT